MYCAFLCNFSKKPSLLFICSLCSEVSGFLQVPFCSLLTVKSMHFFAGQGVCPRHDACSTVGPGHVLHLLPEVIYNNMLSNTNSFQVAQQYVLHMV